MTIRVAVLASGRGSNLQALLDASANGALDAEVVYVAANHSDVPALERAQKAGVPHGTFVANAYGGRLAAQTVMANAVAHARPDLIVLAGFDRIFEPIVFEKLAGIPMINIHPSLLPAFGGVGMLGNKVHQAVLAAGVPESGCTVFRVAPGAVDGGPILVQRRCPVLPGDTVESLGARVLAEEHHAIVEAVAGFAAVRVEG